jgi:hypothetical protein
VNQYPIDNINESDLKDISSSDFLMTSFIFQQDCIATFAGDNWARTSRKMLFRIRCKKSFWFRNGFSGDADPDAVSPEMRIHKPCMEIGEPWRDRPCDFSALQGKSQS